MKQKTENCENAMLLRNECIPEEGLFSIRLYYDVLSMKECAGDLC